jgi:hypothetical protein
MPPKLCDAVHLRALTDIMRRAPHAPAGSNAMEAALLMFDVVGMALVLIWAGRRQGTQGLFAWRTDIAAPPRAPGAPDPKRPERRRTKQQRGD